MEQVKPPSKALFVFVWGVVWGGSTALLMTFFARYKTSHFETPYQIVGRFVIFMAAGTLFGLARWKWPATFVPKILSRVGPKVQLVLFIGLMLGLVYVLWILYHR